MKHPNLFIPVYVYVYVFDSKKFVFSKEKFNSHIGNLKMIQKMHSIKTEIFAGFTSFFTIAYIIIVVPKILNANGYGIPIEGSLAALVITVFVVNFISCFFVRLPYILAPGMGLNAFFAYSLILGNHIPWKTVLGVCFVSSVLFLLTSILPLREKLIQSIPSNMKHAMAAGVGLFLSFLGFKNLGFIVSNPGTIVAAGKVDFHLFLGVLGFILTFYFFIKKKYYAFLAPIILVTLASLIFHQIQMPTHLFSNPSFQEVFFQLDIKNAFQISLIPVILSVLLTSIFDSVSTLIGLSTASGLVDKQGAPLRMKNVLLADSMGSIFASLMGTTPLAVYVESSSGIQAGGRSGITALVVAICFLPFLFFAPIISMVPNYATAPVLIFVGILMTLNIKYLKLDNFEEIVCAFLTCILMPLTFSITTGVIWGVLSYTFLKLVLGKFKEVTLAMWILSAVCLLSLISL